MSKDVHIGTIDEKKIYLIWQDVKNICNYEVKQENQKLKELLKECREVVEFTKTIVNKHTWFDKILIKINGALK